MAAGDWIGAVSLGGGDALLSVVVAVLVVVYLVVRQLTPRTLRGRTLVLVPLVLFYFLWRSLAAFDPTPAKALEVVVDAAVTLVVGLLAARQLRVYANPATGRAMVGGSLRYFLWWLGAFVVKAGLAVAFGAASPSALSGAELLIPVFVLVATRNAYLYWRASRLGLALH